MFNAFYVAEFSKVEYSVTVRASRIKHGCLLCYSAAEEELLCLLPEQKKQLKRRFLFTVFSILLTFVVNKKRIK